MTATSMMKSKRGSEKDSAKSKFILAAIEDINENGVTELSMRRVAQRCGMSPGAPYRHFEDRSELGLEVFRYIRKSWEEICRSVADVPDVSLRERIEDVSVAYIRFLCDNPGFQTILMINDSSMTEEQRAEKAKMTELSRELVEEYCVSVGYSEPVRMRKTFAVRAFIYGAALMINSGELPYNEETLSMVRKCISREFDLQ